MSEGGQKSNGECLRFFRRVYITIFAEGLLLCPGITIRKCTGEGNIAAMRTNVYYWQIVKVTEILFVESADGCFRFLSKKYLTV